MAQKFGLGRGLSSLIPQKRKPIDEAGKKTDDDVKKVSEPKAGFNYFSGFSAQPAKKAVTVAEELARKGRDQHLESNLNPNAVIEIPIDRISPNPFQPRMDFDAAKLNELAESIKQHGIIQPLVVTNTGGKYELVAGERRFQAARLAGLQKIPAIIKKADDQKKMELAVVENVQRENLNPIEEAKSYQKMTDEFQLSQDEIAKKIGKSRSAIANKMRLLALPIEIQNALTSGKITEGHAKVILAIENPEKQRALFEMILKNNMTVRQTEDKTKEISVKSHKRNISVDPETKRKEDLFSQALGTKVKIKKSGGGGKIVIDYYSSEEFNNILSKIQPLR
jgi:ParB family chromosome partitioning protein